MEPTHNREREAREYLEKYKIMELLNLLTSALLFYRPENPREYLINTLERMRIAQLTGVSFPFFMNTTNIVAMFEMIDSSSRGIISSAQYKEALKALGLYKGDDDLKDDGCGITLEKFKEEV
ncbi:EF-hand calcium-binding domain-containing protein 10 [Rhynchocyon petersi]